VSIFFRAIPSPMPAAAASALAPLDPLRRALWAPVDSDDLADCLSRPSFYPAAGEPLPRPDLRLAIFSPHITRRRRLSAALLVGRRSSSDPGPARFAPFFEDPGFLIGDRSRRTFSPTFKSVRFNLPEDAETPVPPVVRETPSKPPVVPVVRLVGPPTVRPRLCGAAINLRQLRPRQDGTPCP
jgi:hypothetical protein